MIQGILFDLDNTLYPASSGLDREIDRQMTIFTSQYLGITEHEAYTLRKTDARIYGTTLQWLREIYGFHDIEAYIKAVHPSTIDAYVSYCPNLVTMLKNLPYPKVILTNSPIEHAERVLDCLKIRPFFLDVYDIRSNNFRGKPYPEAYQRAVASLGTKITDVLFVDDLPSYVTAFQALGGHAVLVDEAGKYGGQDFHSIVSVLDLPYYLENFSS